MYDVLLEKAIERFDIYEFLDENNIEYSKENKNVGVGWIGISECLFCGATNFHAGIKEEGLSYNCWKCNETASILKFVSNVMGVKYNDAKEYIIENSKIDAESVDISVKMILEQREEKPIIKKDLKENIKLPESFNITSKMIKTNPVINSFFDKKKIDVKDCYLYKLKIGIDGNNKGKLIIPILHNKKLVAYQTRTMIGSKFYKSEGSIKSYLYKLDDIPEKSIIVLVEGFFDYVNTYKFLSKYLKNKIHVTTPFSKIMTDDQIKLLKTKKPKQVFSLWDYDAWFQNKFQDRLVCPTGILIPPPNKDPNDLSEKEFIKIFKGFF